MTEQRKLSLQALLNWAASMPDAGFNDQDPRWEWWNRGVQIRRSAEAALAALGSDDALVEAVRALYYAGVWSCDRPVDEITLWTAVRDAAGFEPGKGPKTIASGNDDECLCACCADKQLGCRCHDYSAVEQCDCRPCLVAMLLRLRSGTVPTREQIETLARDFDTCARVHPEHEGTYKYCAERVRALVRAPSSGETCVPGRPNATDHTSLKDTVQILAEYRASVAACCKDQTRMCDSFGCASMREVLDALEREYLRRMMLESITTAASSVWPADAGPCERIWPANWYDNLASGGQCCGKCGFVVRNHRRPEPTREQIAEANYR